MQALNGFPSRRSAPCLAAFAPARVLTSLSSSLACWALLLDRPPNILSSFSSSPLALLLFFFFNLLHFSSGQPPPPSSFSSPPSLHPPTSPLSIHAPFFTHPPYLYPFFTLFISYSHLFSFDIPSPISLSLSSPPFLQPPTSSSSTFHHHSHPLSIFSPPPIHILTPPSPIFLQPSHPPFSLPPPHFPINSLSAITSPPSYFPRHLPILFSPPPPLPHPPYPILSNFPPPSHPILTPPSLHFPPLPSTIHSPPPLPHQLPIRILTPLSYFPPPSHTPFSPPPLPQSPFSSSFSHFPPPSHPPFSPAPSPIFPPPPHPPFSYLPSSSISHGQTNDSTGRRIPEIIAPWKPERPHSAMEPKRTNDLSSDERRHARRPTSHGREKNNVHLRSPLLAVPRLGPAARVSFATPQGWAQTVFLDVLSVPDFEEAHEEALYFLFHSTAIIL
ncbi:hypothetical protein C7M84_023765 [Penaeus vannamei]|uniref:Uncharacterized protein n=1 Tax=Penaeus vannamei TaxID=6689 RepID=A0A3R7PUL8_PENVA|nr:hypothetical protein C7M84_023765 [Penaeus vannamei]